MNETGLPVSINARRLQLLLLIDVITAIGVQRYKDLSETVFVTTAAVVCDDDAAEAGDEEDVISCSLLFNLGQSDLRCPLALQ